MGSLNRRSFIQRSAAATAAGSFVSLSNASARAQAPAGGHGTYSIPARFPEDLAGFKPRVVLIGCGWYGKHDLSRMLQVAPVEVVGVCDVDKKLVEEAADLIAERQFSRSRPETFADYQKMLSTCGADIAIIGTPDHWHALNAIAAMEAGCDVYCQKPISADVAEGQVMVDVAQRLNRVVQVGLQRRSTPHLVEANERFANEQMLGQIGSVETYGYYHMRVKAPPKPPGTYPVPAQLDWDQYCGPAPVVDFHPAMHLRGWRSWNAFGNGITGDIGVHMIDAARWMLGLGVPERVFAQGGVMVEKNSMADVYDTQLASFDFGDLSMSWQMRSWGHPADPDWPWACTIHGEKGTLRFDVWKAVYTPRDKKKEPVRLEFLNESDQYPEERSEKWLGIQTTPATRRHHADFLRRVRDRGACAAPIQEGHISTSMCVLANNATQLGRAIQWDGTSCVGDAEANLLLKRPYRQPWVHPADA